MKHPRLRKIPGNSPSRTGASIDLNATAMTKREALEIASERLGSVVWFCLDLGQDPDAMDKESIRTAHKMVTLALKK